MIEDFDWNETIYLSVFTYPFQRLFHFGPHTIHTTTSVFHQGHCSNVNPGRSGNAIICWKGRRERRKKKEREW